MDDIKKAVVAMEKTVKKILSKKSELNPELNVFDFDRIELAGIKAKR